MDFSYLILQQLYQGDAFTGGENGNDAIAHSYVDGGPRDYVFLCVFYSIYLRTWNSGGNEQMNFDFNKMILYIRCLLAYYKHCQEFSSYLTGFLQQANELDSTGIFVVMFMDS